MQNLILAITFLFLFSLHNSFAQDAECPAPPQDEKLSIYDKSNRRVEVSMTLNGVVVERDPVLTMQQLESLTKSAELGLVKSQINLGSIYLAGERIPKSLIKAYYWYCKAANQGSSIAQEKLGLLHQAGQGTPRDYHQAMNWYLKAADQNQASAQRRIANLYYEGIGVSKDYKRAFNWYLLAAKQNDKLSLRKLGELYLEGKGVFQDNLKAHMFLNLSAAQVDIISQRKRDFIAKSMTTQEVNQAQEMAREWLAEHKTENQE